MPIENYYTFLRQYNIMKSHGVLSFVIVIILVARVFSISSMDKTIYFMDDDGPDNHIADIISSKSYLPDENNLPKASIVKNEGDDVTYLLSKLSDEDLIKMLNDQPSKNNYDLSDIAKVAAGFNLIKENQALNLKERDSNKKRLYENLEEKNEDSIIDKKPKQMPFFRLENKKISLDEKNDANYFALKKLNDLLNSKRHSIQDDSLDDEKRELLFNVLVNQLKTLCCKKTEKQIQNEFDTQKINYKRSIEYMFLILNDEIKTNGSNELITVDPETLQQNSSVLLLGPITTTLTDRQLKLIMKRITMELSKPEYITLLQQLSEGTLGRNNERLIKNFINGSETRRYIKPHRCNHQSKLARIYGGPKWLICTGYINLNTPSLYD
ncbi:uncharacterized protein LOC111002006 [Pieris rapae]|uniref:uncharacterized protein LOC111002006 n=1 Tax=Pieris rapae TaxID=64459 RepID=UPI001E280C43|nr:uncharacterized protein LOC111002006 [Pieris rapae]